MKEENEGKIDFGNSARELVYISLREESITFFSIIAWHFIEGGRKSYESNFLPLVFLTPVFIMK